MAAAASRRPRARAAHTVRRLPGALAGLAAVGVLVLVLGGCGDQPSSSSSTSTGTASGFGTVSSSVSTAASPVPTSAASSSTASATGTGSGSVDSCLVGSWVSTGVDGTAAVNGAPVTFTGGGGEALVVRADGSFVNDYGRAKPITGSGGGHTYTITTSGRGAGTASTSGTRVSIHLSDPNAVTQVVQQDGQTVDNSHPPADNQSTFGCREGGGFTITSSGNITTTYAKAG